jgi:tetratricopeptide (TPR) repeat protein
MKSSSIRWMLLALLASALFFGCGRKPGEKIYREALAEWEAGRLVRARDLLEKSISRRTGSPENIEAFNQLGLLLWEMDRPQEAAVAFQESCRLEPGRYDTLCNWGIALSAQNDFETAGRVFAEAAKIRPDDPRPAAFAGILSARHQRWSEASAHLGQALRAEPNDASLHTALALVELHTTGAEAALNRLQAVLRRNPAFAPALFNTAAIHRYWLRNEAEARRYYELYLKSAPTTPQAQTARAELLALTEGSGGQKLSFTPPRTPNRVLADQHFQKGLEFHKKNDFDSAARWYLKALEADNSHEQAFYNLGLAYYAVNRLELAADAFARAVQINPAFTGARYNCALAEYRLGHTARARRELEAVLSRDPRYAPAIELLARLKKP